LTPDESFNQNGCTSVRVNNRTPSGFEFTAWAAFNSGDMRQTCDCVHWLAIGEK